MSSDKPLNVSDLASALPDREGLVNALKDKLQSMGQPASMIETLDPNVRKRVTVLQDIQTQHDELQKKFFEERSELEARYQKLYQPLYTRRFEIVNGIQEVEGVAPPADGGAMIKGIPEFWLSAMKSNERLAIQITERDEEALKYLRDIKWSKMDDPKGFKLEFFFDSNPFFKNEVLKKEYHMIEEDEPILERAIGTEIEWQPGKNLTQKVMRKKVKKGAKNTKPITKTEDCESFFNFFNPPQVPDEDEEIDQEKAEELQELMEQDYEIGSTIRDKIIPHAISWYTGEAVEGEEYDELEDDDSADIEEEDDDEEDDDDDDDEDEADQENRK